MTVIVVLGAAFVTVAVAALALRRWVRLSGGSVPPPADLVGSLATVTSTIPEDGVGEIAVTADGHRVKLSASAEAAVAAGATVVVVDVASEASVVVAETGF